MDSSSILQFFNVKLDAFIVFVSVIFVVMLITLFFLVLDYMKMRKRYVEFMTGESGKSLEYTIYKRFREIDDLKVGQKDNDDQISIIYNQVRKSYNKIGIHRYDAFSIEKNVTGGTLSFVLALLNSENNGFIINTIHNRAGCHVYMKEIKNGGCEISLSEEENIALDKALNYGKDPEKIAEEAKTE